MSALTNAGGGIIVMGFDTDRHPTTAAEQISKVCQFPLALVNPDRYLKVLASLVHPPAHDVTVQLFENAAGDGKGVAAIVVDAAATSERPYLVGNMLDENDQSIGAYFGFFERKRDVIPPVSIARIQQQLSAGLQWSSIHDRLLAIENHIASWNAPPKPTRISGITRQEREQRLKKARIAVGRDDAPLVYFIASAEGECDFPALFKSSMERLVRFIENPPQLRQQGFEIWADRTSEIVNGLFRRNMLPEYRLIELWKDGLFLFIAPGDEDFLGWSVGNTVERPIHISNFVLTEATLHFCWLMKWIFAEAHPRPSAVRLAVGFDNLKRNVGLATLSDTPEGKMRVIHDRKKAPEPSLEVCELAEWDDYDPERLAFSLIEKVYNWFGFNSHSVPYVDGEISVQKILASKILDRPLPVEPPETPGFA